MSPKRFPAADSDRREVGKWLFQPQEAAQLCSYGIHLYNDGSATFFDLVSFAYIGRRADPDYMAYQFWIREALDELCVGEDADLLNHCSRSIRLDRRTITWILRANRGGYFSLQDVRGIPDVGRRLNDRLEEIFWTGIVRFLTYQPARRCTCTVQT